ncbi:MAG: hypothetical protein IKV90_08035 [Clostridia bacterium]|nr:hypothetical protein [Clostridia bacterium]
MAMELTLRLTGEDAKELSRLCAAVGFPPEMAAIYAVRLVSACVREGLLADMPGAWPREACLPGLFDTGTGGKVLAFRAAERDEE